MKIRLICFAAEAIQLQLKQARSPGAFVPNQEMFTKKFPNRITHLTYIEDHLFLNLMVSIGSRSRLMAG
jgi:hypothetical protein